jgi:hypothetical protein
MHGQQTMKFLNDKAVADAIMAKHAKDPNSVNPEFAKVAQEALAQRAKEKVAA